MLNGETRTLTLDRLDVCNLGAAITSLIINKKNELNDESTAEGRKAVLRQSITKWEALKAEINAQLDEQDSKQFNS